MYLWACCFIGGLIVGLIVCCFGVCLFLLGRFVGFAGGFTCVGLRGGCCMDFVVLCFIMLFAVVWEVDWFWCLWLYALLDLFGLGCGLFTLVAVLRLWVCCGLLPIHLIVLVSTF